MAQFAYDIWSEDVHLIRNRPKIVDQLDIPIAVAVFKRIEIFVRVLI